MRNFIRPLWIAALLLSAGLAIAATKVPRRLLDVTFDAPNAARIQPAEAKGKIRVIALLSSTCEHCIKTVATLNQMGAQYKSKGVEMYGAVVGASIRLDLPAFLAKAKPAFPVGVISEENSTRLADFAPDSHPFVPILLFVDGAGMVQFQFFGDNPLFQNLDIGVRGVLDAMLKPAKPGPAPSK